MRYGRHFILRAPPMFSQGRRFSTTPLIVFDLLLFARQPCTERKVYMRSSAYHHWKLEKNQIDKTCAQRNWFREIREQRMQQHKSIPRKMGTTVGCQRCIGHCGRDSVLPFNSSHRKASFRVWHMLRILCIQSFYRILPELSSVVGVVESILRRGTASTIIQCIVFYCKS
jgi:hypothetical protein